MRLSQQVPTLGQTYSDRTPMAGKNSNRYLSKPKAHLKNKLDLALSTSNQNLREKHRVAVDNKFEVL